MLLIPIGHDASHGRVPWVTGAIFALCALVFFDPRLFGLTSDKAILRVAYHPTDGWSLHLLSAAFLHGDVLHLAGNLLLLWLIGGALEERWGSAPFLAFYLLAAVAANATFGLYHRGSDVPAIGASGAIAALMGAFLIGFSSASVKFWYFVWVARGTFWVRAYYVLPLWFLIQFLESRDELRGIGDGIAYSAHVGGFVFGVAIAIALKATGIEARYLHPLSPRRQGKTPDELEYESAMNDPDRRNAARRLVRLLARVPQHRDAQLVVCRLGMQLDERAYLVKWLPGVLLDLVERNRFKDARELYLAASAQWPDLPIADRVLFVLGRAARVVGDRLFARTVTDRLLTEHPLSLYGAGALHEMAQAYAAAEQHDHAAAMRAQLVAQFPQHPLALAML